jgi:hypothetical protein
MTVWYLYLKLTMHLSSMLDSEPWSVYPIHLQIVRAFGMLVVSPCTLVPSTNIPTITMQLTYC